MSGNRTPRYEEQLDSGREQKPDLNGIQQPQLADAEYSQQGESFITLPVQEPRPDRFGLSLGIYIVIAYGLAWLIALPLWFGEGLATSGFFLYALAMMMTPAIAAVTVVFLIEKPQLKARALGLAPLTPIKRLFGFCALAFVVIAALCFVALPVGALLGQYEADFTGFSGFEQVLRTELASVGVQELPFSLQTMIALQLLNMVLASFIINVIPTLGEEIGWRGWLLPHLLRRFGPWGAIAISGVAWGMWHAPLILLGYNYPDAPGWLALLAMTGMCTIIGGIIGWLRLRGGSVWPAAVAHSTFNAVAGVYILFMAADSHVNTLHASVLGWSGWIVPAIVLVFIVTTGRFRPVSETPALEDRHWRSVELSH